MNKILPLQMEEEPNPQTLSPEILINNETNHQSTPSNYYQEEEPTVNQLPHRSPVLPQKIPPLFQTIPAEPYDSSTHQRW